MNSMPECVQAHDPINDSIVEAAITALGPFHPETPQQAADMLLFWRRRAELTAADVAEVCERMFPAAAPSPDDEGFAERFLTRQQSWRLGYAQGFVDAATARLSVSPGIVTLVQRAAAAMDELTDSDREAVQAAIRAALAD